jgi:hypothetical protein
MPSANHVSLASTGVILFPAPATHVNPPALALYTRIFMALYRSGPCQATGTG